MNPSDNLLNALVLENESLLVRQIQGRPKEAISSASTVDERKRTELHKRNRLQAKTFTAMKKHPILTCRANRGRSME